MTKNHPFGGLFGNSPLSRILQQLIADPFGTYTPNDLVVLTGSKLQPVKEALKVLTDMKMVGLDLTKNEYRVVTNSKRYIALNFLAYAILDDSKGTDCMDAVIKDYFVDIGGC